VGKGDEKLWAILNDKLDTLRGTGDLPARCASGNGGRAREARLR
jgi:hypothetical protein